MRSAIRLWSVNINQPLVISNLLVSLYFYRISFIAKSSSFKIKFEVTLKYKDITKMKKIEEIEEEKTFPFLQFITPSISTTS